MVIANINKFAYLRNDFASEDDAGICAYIAESHEADDDDDDDDCVHVAPAA